MTKSNFLRDTRRGKAVVVKKEPPSRTRKDFGFKKYKSSNPAKGTIGWVGDKPSRGGFKGHDFA